MLGFMTRAEREQGGGTTAKGRIAKFITGDRARQIAEATGEDASAAAPAPAPPERQAPSADPSRATKDNPAGIRFANGGPVRGPGTGTSDDISKKVPEGTYIMPADSTQQIGEGALASMGSARGFQPGQGVPVQVSNGEYEVPPEQVHAVGVQALDAMKDATHQPVPEPTARGFAPQAEEPPVFFANGGVVDEEERRRQAGASPTSPSNIFPQSHLGRSPYVAAPAAAAAPAPSVLETDPQARADRAAIGAAWDSAKGLNESVGRGIMDATTYPLRAAASAYDNTVVRGMRAAGINAAPLAPALVPEGANPTSLTPFSDQARRLASPAQPAPAATQAQVRAVDNDLAQAAPSARGFAPATTLSTSAGAPGAVSVPSDAQQIAPGVYQHGRGKYSDQPSGMGFSPGFTGRPTAQNMAAADALEARGMAERAGQRATVDAGAARGFAPGAGLTVIGDDAQADRVRRRAFGAASTPYTGSPNGQLTANQVRVLAGMDEANGRNAVARETTAANNAASLQREAMQQEGANARTAVQEGGASARAAASNAVQRGELDLRREAQAPNTRAAQRQEALYQRYEAAKTPEERSAIAQQLRDLNGKEPANRFTVVPGGQEIDPTTQQSVTRPARVFNNQTGQFVDQAPGQGAASGPASITNDAVGKQRLAALPQGAEFIGPDGKLYRKS